MGHMDLSHRTIGNIGKYQAMELGNLESGLVVALYRQALRLRRTEEALIGEYHPADEMRCPVHFCIGQEAVPAALSMLLESDDYLFSHHRSHGYYFAKGCPMQELFAEIYGKATGANGGKAGSQDVSHVSNRFFSGAILAGAVSIAAGTAFALQLKRSTSVSVSGFGEGATDEGAFWEVANYAGVKRLPLLLVCENNRYATYSDQLKRQASDNICARVRPFGVRAEQVFGNDVLEVYRTLQAAFEHVRTGQGPALVEAYTHRWNSHVGPEDDGNNHYRTREELDFWKTNCPVVLLEEKLFETGLLTAAAKARMEAEIAEEVAAHFAFAKSSPFPARPDWHIANNGDATPLADRLLGTAVESEFNHFQADARLEPY
jgi:TPP-dependent pyruvate/acetoin dehydrogenase alpha subunit